MNKLFTCTLIFAAFQMVSFSTLADEGAKCSAGYVAVRAIDSDNGDYLCRVDQSLPELRVNDNDQPQESVIHNPNI